MTLRTACLALVLLGTSTGAFAQSTPSALTPQDPEKVALAVKILAETHVQDNMAQALDLLIPQMVAVVKRQSPNLSDATVKLLSDMMLQAMKDRLPKLMELNANVYAEHFTLDELKAIEAFDESPAGQKGIAETPKIMQEVAPIGAAWGAAAAQDVMAEVLAKLRAQGMKL